MCGLCKSRLGLTDAEHDGKIMVYAYQWHDWAGAMEKLGTGCLQLTGKNDSESYTIEKSMLAIRRVQLWACVLDSNRLRADTVGPTVTWCIWRKSQWIWFWIDATWVYFFFVPWYVISYWKKLSHILLLLAPPGCLAGLVAELPARASVWLLTRCLIGNESGDLSATTLPTTLDGPGIGMWSGRERWACDTSWTRSASFWWARGA